MWAWYHRQFWEAAKDRFLSDDGDRIRSNQSITDYFTNTLQSRFRDRGISHQPLYWKSTNGEVRFNSMKLCQLPTSIGKSRNPNQFQTIISNLKFIAAKCAAGFGRELIKDLSTDHQFCHFAASQMHILEKHPELTLQNALNTGDHSSVYRQATEATNVTPWLDNPSLVVHHSNKAKGQDPCVLTLAGHTGEITQLLLETIKVDSASPLRCVSIERKALERHSIGKPGCTDHHC